MPPTTCHCDTQVVSYERSPAVGQGLVWYYSVSLIDGSHAFSITFRYPKIHYNVSGGIPIFQLKKKRRMGLVSHPMVIQLRIGYNEIFQSIR